MRPTPFVVVSLIAVSIACASSQQSSASNGAQAVTPRKRASNVITQDELDAPQITSRDAYTALRMLRPNFFVNRGPTGSSEPGAGDVMVSHDYGPLQSAQTLKGINTMGIVEVRYLNSEEAGLRFGLNANGSPVIVLLHNKNQ